MRSARWWTSCSRRMPTSCRRWRNAPFARVRRLVAGGPRQLGGRQARARLRLEEVEPRGIDGEIDVVTGDDPLAAVDPGRELRPLVVGEQRAVLVLGRRAHG